MQAAKRLLTLLLAMCVAFPSRAAGIELKQPTVGGFQRYVQQTENRINSELADPARFLYVDSFPEKQKRAMLERLHGGYVLVERMHTRENGKEIAVPDGLVHHWIAIGFIPGSTRDRAVALAQDYPRHPQLYAPDIQRARVLSHTSEHFSVYFRFFRQSIVTVAYNTEFSVDYFFPDSSRAYSFSRAVKIAEVESPGKPEEKELPVGKDHGYMWRANLYTRYLERDGGVYVQIEFLVLSRSVPAIFAWIVNPYIRSIPRDYLTRYILATRKALSPGTGK
ncbi:MAG TPA: hypothetical protein VED66_17480 [Candidatus Sulfotelmatobacter sp.]|nr:hypothetical protein [Candidatus Sulfotelmatobacter sp.]